MLQASQAAIASSSEKAPEPTRARATGRESTHSGVGPTRRGLERAGRLLAALALLLGGACSTHTEPFRDADGRTLPRSIATMEDHEIGGISQRIWFRGVDVGHPALVLLHGGPGASEAALFRHFDAALEQHFLVVSWEQRGAGRSFHADIPRESMTIARFVEDLDEVVELVRRRFGQRKVVLLGHSWGTVIGTLYAEAHPDRVAAYVGVAQLANEPVAERLSYDWALARAREQQDDDAIAELEEIGPPPHAVDAMLTLRRQVERFGGSFHADLSTGKLIFAALSTSEANLADLVRFGRGNRFSLETLWPEISRLDLTRARRFEVPIFFVLGRHDWQIPAVASAAYFERIDAPSKRLVWFEGSAHNVPFEEPDAFTALLIREVLPLARVSAPPAGTGGTAAPDPAPSAAGGPPRRPRIAR